MTIEEKIDTLIQKVDRQEMQVNRICADIESEKDTRSRSTDYVVKQIKENHDELMNILYGADRKSGLIVDVDRSNGAIERAYRAFYWCMGIFGSVLTSMIVYLIHKA